MPFDTLPAAIPSGQSSITLKYSRISFALQYRPISATSPHLSSYSWVSDSAISLTVALLKTYPTYHGTTSTNFNMPPTSPS